MLKKISVIILTYMLVLSGVIVNVSASEESDFVYSYNQFNDTYNILGYTGDDTNIVIPSKINGKTVTSIQRFDCENLNVIDSVTIPAEVTYVDFGINKINNINVDPNNSNLVMLDGALYSSDYSTLYKCTSGVISLEIPKTVKTIGNNCFSGTRITTMIIPDTVTYISNIYSLDNLKELTINATCNFISIGGCSSLEKLNLSASVINFNLYENENLKEVNISTGNKTLKSIDGIVYCDNSLYYYPEGKQDELYRIPDGITNIGRYSSLENKYIKELVISSELENIDTFSIIGCTSLETITVEPDNPYYMFEEGFLYKGNELIYNLSKGNKTKIIVADNITSIADYAFAYDSVIEEIVLPNNLETIGISAFKDCINLKSINIPKNINTLHEATLDTYVGNYNINFGFIFEGCNKLESVKVAPESNSYVIENGALYTKDYSVLLKQLDKNIENIVVNDNTLCIEMEAFRDCSDVKAADLKNVTDLMYLTFANCSSLESVNFDNVNHFHWGMTFYNCDSITDIILPEAYTNKNNYTMSAIFDSCDSLQSIDLNKAAFFEEGCLVDNCPNINKLILPKSIELAYFNGENSSNILYYVYDDSYIKKCIEDINLQIKAGTYYENRELIKYKVINELNDEDTRIIIDSLKNDNINEETKLKVNQIKSGDSFDLVSNTFDNFVLYNITLMDENNQNIVIDEECEIKIPISKEMNIDNCKVYYLDENNQYTDMNAKYQDGYMVFKTTNFNKYIITDSEFKTLLGDINNDGLIGYADAVLILQSDSKILELTELQKSVADVNRDGIISYSDAVQILRKDAGLITEF